MLLSEWFPLSHEAVDLAVRREIGAYALSKSDEIFKEIRYVGRDDKNVHRRLGEHVAKGKYSHFMFTNVGTIKEGYELECRLYHDYNPVDNNIHPAAPDGTNFRCPIMFCEHAAP
ncbi:MAG: hypothetical protein OXF33_03100 [Rhodospirillales bacterium]|nr:hypothetical protein [Rhodospirillales bacterium]